MPVFKWDEFCASNASDWFVASKATFGEEFTKAFGAVGLFVTAGEAFAGQTLCTVSASETFPMPRLVLVCHAAAGDDLIAFDATSGEFFFVTLGTIYLLFTGNETLGTDWYLAYTTTETLFMPLSSLVFHLFGTGPEDFMTTVAPWGELLIVTASTINPVTLRTKLLVY